MNLTDRNGNGRQNEYRRLLQRTPALLRISDRAWRQAQEMGAWAPQAQIDVSMYVLGPVLYSFLTWVLRRAQETGKKRLYFLARDGWMMYRMAQGLCEAKGLFPECRYLYASRYAWRVPQQHLKRESSLEQICRSGMHVTFADVMRRAGLTREETEKIASLIRPGKSIRKVLTRRELLSLRTQLAGCGPFLELAERHSRSRYAGTLAYLSREGLLDHVPYALVDSGWTGSLQESLTCLLESAGYGGRVEGYYFGLYSLPDAADAGRFHGWYFGPGSRAGRKARFSNCLLESVFTAPHGMTEGYEEGNEGPVPRLARLHPKRKAWTKRQLGLLEIYMETLLKSLDEVPEQEAQLLRAEALLSRFMSAPSRKESICYGNAFFSDEVTEERMRPLAARLTRRQLLELHLPVRLLLFLSGKRNPAESGWTEGSVRLYGGRLYPWHRAGILFGRYAVYLKMQYDYQRKRKAAGK
ncbi:MAG TPA: hypothetical protein H9700_09030 [Candidatus Eisenbergiella intestinipullorum]|nr:hypothetical protein [Candidatus Eisenbergiella intestinipullorum]